MRKLILYASCFGLGLTLVVPTRSAAIAERHPAQVAVPAVERLAQYDTTEYETYYNSRFDFTVQYPTDLVMPLSPPTNKDGRSFVSPSRDIRMVVYGRHQVDQSLEAYFRSQLQSYEMRGAEVTYSDLGDDEYVISGYDPAGDVFYHRTLLRGEDFLVLGLTYDRALQPEFDPMVAEIAESFVAGGDRATKQLDTEVRQPDQPEIRQPYEPPSDLRQIQIYFPEAETEIFTEVAPVTRTTDRADVLEYAVEQLLVGPTEAEQERVNALPIQPVGSSNCGEETFTVDLIQGTAIVKFCRDVVVGGLGDSSSFERSLLSTLTQFAIVTQVIVLDANGDCFFDPRGNNDCLTRLPRRYTIGT